MKNRHLPNRPPDRRPFAVKVSTVPLSLLFPLTAALLLGAPPIANADAPYIQPPFIPGISLGTQRSHWIAPYVLASTHAVGPEGHVVENSTVQWFDDHGAQIQDISGKIDATPEYILETRKGQTVVHDIFGQWSFVLPKKAGWDEGRIAGCGDTFVQELRPTNAQIAVDVYTQGKLTSSTGPFAAYKGRGIELGADGSVALLIWKSPKKQTVQVVVLAPGGTTHFIADCGPTDDSPFPLPGGDGVLLDITRAVEPPVKYRYLSAKGAPTTFDIGPNARPVAALGSAGWVLFNTSLGDVATFKLIDCPSGQTLWEITQPVEPFPSMEPQTLVVGDKIIFYGQTFTAVDAQSGKIIARWKPEARGTYPPLEPGHLVQRGSRLFYVTDQKFTEINPADITALRNGWH